MPRRGTSEQVDLSLTDAQQRFSSEVRDWLEAHLSVRDLTAAGSDLSAEVARARAWQKELAEGGWVGIDWPADYGGRGASPVEVAIFNAEYARSGAPQLVNRVGINLAGPTLLAHGTPEQCKRWLPGITTAEEIWCQLFSEPDAGSDLSSLSTRATETVGGWSVSGQKVWTSYAQFAKWGLCLARSVAGTTGARGLSLFVVDVSSPGVEIRPLVQMTGEAEFNEVFLDEVFVPADCLVGERNQGWAVANTTLAHERGTFPFKEQVVHEVFLEELYQLAESQGSLDDPAVAEALAAAAVELRVLRLHNWRTLTRLEKGHQPGPESSVVKLTWTGMTQTLSDAALAVVGSASPLWFGASANPGGGRWQRQWLWSKAASIAGGTSEIQRTVIGDRILGLPR
ncbi:MAG: acyl-CoA dehydrogenase family protein [Acidimicrobiales bacterium]